MAAPTQIVWRPSTWVIGALWSFGPLGAISLLATDLPALAAWPAALLVMVLAIRAANREAARAQRLVAWPTHGPPTVDGQPLHDARLQWRGPLAFLQWRQGRRLHTLSWWPDTLPPASRRELRLAVGTGLTARKPA